MNRPLPLTKIHNNCAPLRLFLPISALVVAALVLLAACNPATEAEALAVTPAEDPPLLCGDDGRLSAELYGAVEATLDWGKNDLECTGMPRPEGRGVRLRFAAIAGDEDRQLAVIIAIPDFVRSSIGGEFSSNVTLIEEGNGRFFSTPDHNNCLTDVASVEAIDDSGDRYSVIGALYCVSPLPEINGDSSISIPEMQFTGLLDWSAS